MIATLTTDRLIVSGIDVVAVTVRGVLALARKRRPRRLPVRSSVTIRGPRPYDWEKEP